MDDPNIDGYETYCIGKMDAYCKELEAKNGELEKKLEAVEMVHSNYVNVSCDLYSTLEKKLEIATDCLKELRPVIEQGEDWELGKWIDEALSKIKSEGL